ncbi:MAG: SDR family NAD(P)-dependent oxidoreductase [Bacteroidales bacterium]|nr:SDR family NAD(P)-dependent oxidoreductase [Bacteroidales bacterium]
MSKTIIITGSNSGIGKAAAIRFAQQGHTVVMACRNLATSAKTRESIIAASGNNKVDLMQLDVSSFESIRDFCEEFKSKYSKLDILINNAGYFNYGEKHYQHSQENIEMSFATNAFGPFLLTKLLRPLLAKSENPRVLNASTTNIKYFFDPKRSIDWDNLRGEHKNERKYNAYKMYGDSKMAFLMLSFKQAEEYEPDGINLNSVLIPAIKISNEKLRGFKTFYWRTMARLMNLTARPQKDMAECYYEICTSEKFSNLTGKLLNIQTEIMGKPDLEMKWTGKTTIQQLRHMTMVPRYAVLPENKEKIWDLGIKLIQETNPIN